MTLPKDFFKHPFAHRALHDVRAGRPENAMSSIKAAMAAGYGIEVDLQLSKDGVPMVFHDDNLQRLTPQFGLPREFTAKELGAMRLTHGREGIPTFEALLDAVAGSVPLLVEIKDQSGELGPETGDMEAQVCALVAAYPGPIALMSFNGFSVGKCAEFAPDVPRGLVTDAFLAEEWPGVPAARLAHLAEIADFDDVGACFISHNHRDLGMPVVAKLKDDGVPVACWTVRSEAEEVRAREVADQVTSEGYLADIA